VRAGVEMAGRASLAESDRAAWVSRGVSSMWASSVQAEASSVEQATRGGAKGGVGASRVTSNW
jgi:hypothetical protein